MTTFDTVFFDNGDTLFHKGEAPPSLIALAAKLGVDLNEEQATSLWAEVKNHKPTDQKTIFERNRSSEGHHRYYLTRYEPLDKAVPGLAQLFYDNFKTSPDSMIPYPDTRETLQALKANGIKIGIISNTGWDIRQGYVASGLDHIIDNFVLSHEEGRAKPEREIFLRACANLDADPRRALMVGNNPMADGGGAQIGMTCLILPPVERTTERGLHSVLRIFELDTASVRT